MKKLRVSHFPQIPCKPFHVEVESLEQAKLICDIMADYDLFQYENKIKTDYANITVVEEFDEEESEWVNWCDEETGIDDIYEYFNTITDKKDKQIPKSLFIVDHSKSENPYPNCRHEKIELIDIFFDTNFKRPMPTRLAIMCSDCGITWNTDT